MKSTKLLLKTSRYIPIIAIIVMLTLALVRATTTTAGGTLNPKDASPI